VDRDPLQFFFVLFALVIAIPVHEFAHALSAVNNGDDGPRREGRLSILPTDHFDPLGAIFCVVSAYTGFGLGWGRPVLVNPNVLHNPRWGMCKIAAWGPTSNLLLAIGFALPLRFGWVPQDNQVLWLLLLTCLQVNLSLMLFNLIPIGPLDGAKVLVAFLPDREAYEFSKFMEQWGGYLLLALVFLGGRLLPIIIGIPMLRLMAILLGPGV
jgi:Zn-dependent protease